MSKGKFLIVEDEFVVAENLRTELQLMGYEVVGMAFSGAEALELARQKRPDLVLMDIKLREGMDGIETAIHLRQELDIPSFFLTAFSNESFLERAKLADPLGYLIKPFERNGLRASLEMAHYKARLEHLLKESESRFRSMFENSPVAYLALDEHNSCLDLNAEFRKLLGYNRDELIGRNFLEFCPSDKWHMYLQEFAKLKDSGRLEAELEVVCKDNTLLTVVLQGRIQPGIDGKTLKTHCILHNISERKRIEEERRQFKYRIQQAQKAESLGRMAGAVAHHFNNMLNVVMGNLELFMMDLPRQSHSTAYITEAMKASRKAAEMSRLMLTYLGQTIAKKERLDFAKVVEETQSLLSASIPGNVHVRTECSTLGVMIDADRVHIQQILNNLFSNAVEAIGEREGDITITVETGDIERIKKLQIFPMDWQPKEKNYICLSVADTGPGLDAATIEKIFDPFYTTKFTGRGMGLSVVLGLTQTYEGVVTVENTDRAGAVFRVYFPVVAGDEFPCRQEAHVPMQIKGSGLVLVVDDEPLVRDLARTMLERQLGYTVIVADDGRKAIGMFQAQKDDFRFVLLDLSMPGMNGWQTLTAIRKIQPGIPVILASGFDEALVMRGKHPELPQAFLQKPYQLSELKAAISRAEARQG
ncbi:MAG: response regulator [Pseudomonadota bacterium]